MWVLIHDNAPILRIRPVLVAGRVLYEGTISRTSFAILSRDGRDKAYYDYICFIADSSNQWIRG
jgi:hypothetical protein